MGTQELTLRVDGMTCGHCEKTVEKGLLAADGVRSARADHAARIVTLEVEPGVDMALLKTVISDLGYTPLD